MNMCRLVYISEAARPFSPEELEALIAHSSENNRSRGISGLLLYSGGQFMQALEEEEMRVHTLYSRIAVDPRHTNVRQLLLKRVDSRLFPDWGMQLAHADRLLKLERDRLDRVLLRFRLKPGPEDAGAALALLQEFRSQLMSDAA